MKLLKKLFGIKTTYAIPSDNGVDITKGKKYKVVKKIANYMYIRDNNGITIFINVNKCSHINGSSWQIITE